MGFRVVGLSVAFEEGIFMIGTYSKDEHVIVSAKRRVVRK